MNVMEYTYYTCIFLFYFHDRKWLVFSWKWMNEMRWIKMMMITIKDKQVNLTGIKMMIIFWNYLSFTHVKKNRIYLDEENVERCKVLFHYIHDKIMMLIVFRVIPWVHVEFNFLFQKFPCVFLYSKFIQSLKDYVIMIFWLSTC